MADVRSVVRAAIDDLDPQLPADRRLGGREDAAIVGDGSVLDSLAVLNLLVAVEERCADELGLTVDLLDEHLLAERDGPLATVASLVAHLEGLR